MKNRYLNNETLLKHLKKGDANAFAYIMDTHYDKLCVYATNLTNDPYTAQDIVQNVFLRIWEMHKKLKTNYSINNYLYRSVYHEFIDQYRKNKLLTSLEEEHIKQLNAITQEKDVTEITRLIELVKSEIQNLPPKCKAVFVMSKLEGLTYNEIAEHNKIAVRTVEMHMARAFEIMREKLGDRMESLLFLLFSKKLTH
ncbi:RNA polymerase sigma-70 factor [Flavivirga amylovorans]|uniref:RNA polymerase sigma-70 factor n=1 Tax=Flavivirga amylovorans TaxID=870486 RepID=A0ABT8X1F3_9FLAO|nr:RNA polymerase sigma-70 factor [Flavivirga amylovorans]MDO5987533.1 RNA polymerase sigma-70 factor [Flavivirga amylovorans]